MNTQKQQCKQTSQKYGGKSHPDGMGCHWEVTSEWFQQVFLGNVYYPPLFRTALLRYNLYYIIPYKGFPGSSAGKESTCNARDLDLIPRLGRSSGEGKGYSVQYWSLENSMDCIIHGVPKSQTRLTTLFFHVKYATQWV